MSINSHGMPSRVRAIAEIGRLLGDHSARQSDQQSALNLLLQDHADLDEVEANAALWALGEMPPSSAALEALLSCAPQLMHGSDGALQFLTIYKRWQGAVIVPEAHAAFQRIERLALHDAELAAHLGLFR